MPNIELSVVIPTHNRKDLLQEMLMALSHQSLSPDRFEVIVMIDGSSDGTLEMLRELQTPYPLRFVYQNQSGVAATRNNGARAAIGEIVLFLDDDLLPYPTLLESHLNTQNTSPQGVVLGRLVPADTGDRGGWNAWEDRILLKHYKAVEDGSRPPAGRRLYSGNFSVPKETFLTVGGFNQELPRGEDVELGFRLERHGVPFYFNADAVADHRGYRSFASWCGSAYVYGQTDVLLAIKDGHDQVLPEIFGWYKGKTPAIRGMVKLGLGKSRMRSTLVQALKMVSGSLYSLRFHRLSHAGYSLIFNLQYWNGVADELGGRDKFYRQMAQLSKATEATVLE